MNEKKLKHLEFLQIIITRMNSNSFLIKGWSITLVSALFALAAKDANLNYVIITYFAIPTFWGLDAYYLSQERQYRALYKDVCNIEESNITFSLDASQYGNGDKTWFRSLFSKTVWIVYFTLLIITILIMYFL
jgi:hypothetical protein